ncbi:MAG: 7,8-didemethyl-8-hydroxy-5-deazariboflavin synthase subunit CofG, partial [Candidatus Hydrothermarchaeaceae archaeon]
MPTVTYSKNVFLPLTNACRNACAYCGFRSDEPTIMERREVLSVLKSGRKAGCKEALFTFGERPESNDRIKKTLHGWGYANMTEYLLDLCRDAIRLGLLPHTNAGILERDEMMALKEVNASMGLMLESASERLCGKGMPHENSPGKLPEVRLEAIKNAGKLKIPFTTGLLIGIGETPEEVLYSIEKIKGLNDRHQHIQEVIIQNFKPKAGTRMEGRPEPGPKQMVDAVRTVMAVMPDMHVQVPPNLNPETWPALVSEGVDDIGGIPPTTKDYINPEAE